jgi:hypothetical protein
MGSLAYAVGGGLAGAGKGLADVGEQGFKEQLLQKQNDLATAREEAMVRLRDKFEKENIENQQQFQTRAATAVAAKQEAIEKAKITSSEKEHTEHETHADTRADILAKSRVTAAGMHAAASRKPVPEFTYRTLTEQGSVDPKTGQLIPGRSYVQMAHKSGLQLVQVGGGVDPKTGVPNGGILLEHGANDTEFPNAAKVARAPAAAVTRLMTHPEEGMEFFGAYHYLPTEWMPKYQAQQQQQQQGPGLPKFAAPGTTAGASQSLGGETTAGEDAEDNNAAEAGYDTSYANTGDRGPQASDNEPAR